MPIPLANKMQDTEREQWIRGVTPDGKPPRWRLSAHSGSRVGGALGVGLLVVSALGVAWTHEVNAEIAAAHRAVTVADLYQDARYDAVLEDAELNTFRLDGDQAARVDHDAAVAALDAALAALARLDEAHPHAGATVDSLVRRHGPVTGAVGSGPGADRRR